MVFRALLVDMHYSRETNSNWHPWTSEDRQYHGWRIEPNDPGGITTYIYTIPDLDHGRPAVNLYTGPHGDPEQDHYLGRVLARPDSKENQ